MTSVLKLPHPKKNGKMFGGEQLVSDESRSKTSRGNADIARVIEDTSRISTPANIVPSASATKTRVKPPKHPDTAEMKAADRVTSKRSTKKKNELVPPADYAARLVRGEIKVRPGPIPFLRGKKIYYHGADLNYASKETKAKMEIVSISARAGNFYGFAAVHLLITVVC